MQAEDFTDSRSGELIRTISGNLTFVPNPLPPAIEYSSSLVAQLSEADAALAELSGVGRQLANPALIALLENSAKSRITSARREPTNPPRSMFRLRFRKCT